MYCGDKIVSQTNMSSCWIPRYNYCYLLNPSCRCFTGFRLFATFMFILTSSLKLSVFFFGCFCITPNMHEHETFFTLQKWWCLHFSNKVEGPGRFQLISPLYAALADITDRPWHEHQWSCLRASNKHVQSSLVNKSITLILTRSSRHGCFLFLVKCVLSGSE